MALEQQGLNAIATLGIHLSEEVKEELTLLQGKDVVIAFDNDSAGIQGTFNICEYFPNAKVYSKISAFIKEYIKPACKT